MVRLSFRLLTGALCLSLLAACGGKALGSETAGQTIQTATGYNVTRIAPADRDRKPTFKGETLDGRAMSQRDVLGSVTVVNFWASWCGPCRKEEANLQALYTRYRANGVAFLGVNTRDTKVDARAFLEEFGVTYPSLFDRFAVVAHRFRVLFLPATFVLDTQGRVAAVIVGATTDERQLASIIDEELAR